MSDPRETRQPEDGKTVWPAEPALQRPTQPPNSPDAKPPLPDQIGPYRVLELIGEGGFGTVYLAEQREPIQRRVAVKVVKLGMDTEQVIARFEAERQALALMDHPNIAKVFVAGATASGRPYFAMELVRGVPITAYCDEHRLNVRERLELFIPVCNAVQHAHQKGVIHRDIKPSNILVTLVDGKPEPKVIDFGIAKATTASLTDRTMHTHQGQMIGTPQYMSPEQAEMGALDIDTRTDVYSLGVVLYELLTGSVPVEDSDLFSGGYANMKKAIRDFEAPRPSVRVGTGTRAAPDSTVEIARRRRAEPAALSRLLRGDLDWIALKAMEKDRTRRYATANSLAQDIDRHLKNEPVEAGPPTAAYRLGKFAVRNRGAIAAALAVLAALVAGLSVAVVGFVRASDQRDAARAAEAGERAAHAKAQAEADKAAAVNDFLQGMLAYANPDSSGHARDVTVREALDDAASRVDAGVLKDQPEIEAAVRTTVGRAYRVLAIYDKAERHLRAALAIRTGLHGEGDVDSIETLNDLAMLLDDQGKLDEALPIYQRLTKVTRSALGDDHPNVAAALINLGSITRRMGKLEEAERLFRDGLAAAKKSLGDENETVATAMDDLSLALQDLGKNDEAEPLCRGALAIYRKIFGPDSLDVARSMNNLATLLQHEGKLAEAEEYFRDALTLIRKILGDEHPEVATALNNLGGLLNEQGKLTDAEPLYREALAIRRKTQGVDHPETAWSAVCLGVLLDGMDKSGEAEPLLRAGLARLRETLGNANPQTAWAMTNLGACLADLAQWPEAESLLREALEARRKALPPGHRDTAAAMALLGSVLSRSGRATEGETLEREALAGRETALPKGHWLLAETRGLVGEALAAQGKFAEAESMMQEAHTALKANPACPARALRDSSRRLAAMYRAWGKTEEAGVWEAGKPGK